MGSILSNRCNTCLLIVAWVVAGCGDQVGSEPPRLTRDIEWAVRIDFSGQHFCTGLVLSEDWLLTAAHCLEDAVNDRITVTQAVFDERTVLYDGTATLLIHPDYEPIGRVPHRWHDIALIGLRDGAVDVPIHAPLCGLTKTFAILMDGSHDLYTVGYGMLPEPATGLCSDAAGAKKRYDGLALRVLTGPLLGNALGVELEGREGALCKGDSGAPLLFDVDGVPHAFAVFSGEQELRPIFHGTLIGPKIDWIMQNTEVLVHCK